MNKIDLIGDDDTVINVRSALKIINFVAMKNIKYTDMRNMLESDRTTISDLVKTIVPGATSWKLDGELKLLVYKGEEEVELHDRITTFAALRQILIENTLRELLEGCNFEQSI